MVLKRPNREDKQKIHSEVNQIVNQRLLLTTLAVTIFGAMVAWLIPRIPLTQSVPVGGQSVPVGVYVYITSLLLTVVLFALFLLMHHLTCMLRLFTTYLDETDASNWEKDWSSYRDKFSYLGYTKSQSLVFLLLGSLSTGFPFLLWVVYPFTLEPKAGAVVNAIIGILYVVFVSGMGLCGWFAKENDMRCRWKELNQ